MRSYEILLILPADADDKVVQSVADRITGVVSGSGGEITKVDRWGKRRFAYELDKLTEGFYVLVEMRAVVGDSNAVDDSPHSRTQTASFPRLPERVSVRL